MHHRNLTRTAEVLPPSRLQPLTPSIRPNQSHSLASNQPSNPSNRHPRQTPRHLHTRRSREQQLIVLPTIQSKLQTPRPGSQRMHRQRRLLHLSAHARLRAQMPQVRRQPITQVNTSPGQPTPPQSFTHPHPRLRKQMRMLTNPNPPHPAPSQHPLQLRRRPTQPPRAIQRVTSPAPTPPQRLTPRSRAHQRNIRQNRARLRRIPTRQRTPVPIPQPPQPLEKPLNPTPPAAGSQHLPRQRQRKKSRHRHSPHRRQIAQPTRQAAVPNRLRRMQIPPEVPSLQREVGRHQHLVARCRPQNRAIVPDPQRQPRKSPPAAPSNLLDQRPFPHRLGLFFHRDSSINGGAKVAEISLNYCLNRLLPPSPFARIEWKPKRDCGFGSANEDY